MGFDGGVRMAAEPGAGVVTVAGTAAVATDMATIGAVGPTVGTEGSPGCARTGGANATMRGTGAGAGAIAE